MESNHAAITVNMAMARTLILVHQIRERSRGCASSSGKVRKANSRPKEDKANITAPKQNENIVPASPDSSQIGAIASSKAMAYAGSNSRISLATIGVINNWTAAQSKRDAA